MESMESVLDDFVEGLFRLLPEGQRGQVGEADLTPVQARALTLLRTAPQPASRLAAALGISAPALTQLTDRLGRKNLIERRNVKSDRRAVMIALTEKGGHLIDGVRRRRNEVVADTLSLLGEDERMEVIAALSKIAAVLPGSDRPLTLDSAPRKAAGPRHRAEKQTAIELPEASKEVGEVPVSLPIKRRMRIEWD